MSLFGISLAKEKELIERMHQLGVREEDMKESFVRASGPGGQKVNKTSSCVVLRHLPTGIVVKCDSDRSRAINRFLARRRLLDKIEERERGYVLEEKQRIEKIRRQKRKRSKRAKEKMLAEKHRRSEKKGARHPVSLEEE